MKKNSKNRKYLVIGSGAREHAIAWALSLNPYTQKVFISPGNFGMTFEPKCEIVKFSNYEQMINFAGENQIDTVIVGPEQPLVEGFVDLCKMQKIDVFGPPAKSAMLEGSKIFAKNLMKKYGIQTAKFETFDNFKKAADFLSSAGKYPVVIKVDGLAEGKGVFIVQSYEEAMNILDLLFNKSKFGKSGEKIVIEECLQGYEASIIVISDGKSFKPLISAKDHKKAFDNEQGPNTGGMGAISPNPLLTEDDMQKFEKRIMIPTFNALEKEGLLYAGALYFGVMITKDGPFLLEYNVRFGDPETSSILFSLDSDFSTCIDACINGRLDELDLSWKEGFSVTLVAASKGYPDKYEVGYEIAGYQDFIGEKNKDNLSKIFFAGVDYKDNKLITNRGRVLNIVSRGKTLAEARKNVYQDIEKIKFDNLYYRKDI